MGNVPSAVYHGKIFYQRSSSLKKNPYHEPLTWPGIPSIFTVLSPHPPAWLRSGLQPPRGHVLKQWRQPFGSGHPRRLWWPCLRGLPGRAGHYGGDEGGVPAAGAQLMGAWEALWGWAGTLGRVVDPSPADRGPRGGSRGGDRVSSRTAAPSVHTQHLEPAVDRGFRAQTQDPAWGPQCRPFLPWAWRPLHSLCSVDGQRDRQEEVQRPQTPPLPGSVRLSPDPVPTLGTPMSHRHRGYRRTSSLLPRWR